MIKYDSHSYSDSNGSKVDVNFVYQVDYQNGVPTMKTVVEKEYTITASSDDELNKIIEKIVRLEDVLMKFHKLWLVNV